MNRIRKPIDRRLRVPLAIAVTAQVALTAATLIDLRRRDRSRIVGSKGLWTAAAFVNFLGPIAYFTVGRRP